MAAAAVMAGCLLSREARASLIVPRAASLRSDEAMRWLARVYPSGTLASTSVLGSGPTPALLLAGAVITLESVWSAPVLTARADAVILTWRIHRAVDGLWRERQFGVAVFRDGQPVWSMESEPAFSFRGLPLGLASLRAGDPLAIRFSYEYTTDPAAPRRAHRRERLFAFRSGRFVQILDDATEVDAHGRMIDVVYGYGAPDQSGWSAIAKSAAEDGSTRTCEFVFVGDTYLETTCSAVAAHPTILPLRLPGPVVIDGPELCFNLHASPGLPLLRTLDTVDTVIDEPGHWQGPAATQVRLYGGWRAGHGDLIVHYWVRTPAPPSTGWAESCELWLWDAERRTTWGWAFAPGDFSVHPPVVRQLVPRLIDRPAGLGYDARRHDDGYSMVVELDAARLGIDRAAAGRYRLCLLTRFGTGGGTGYAMATSRTFASADPATFNPLAFEQAEQLDITNGWMDAVIVAASPDGRRVTARAGGRPSLPPGKDPDLMLNVTAASQLRTLHGTAIALSVLRPGDGAEIGYHYLEGVRVVDWLRPYEKTVEGVVTGVDPARATVAFRDLAGRPRRMRVPPTAGKPSYDQQALVDLTAIRVGDEVTVWYVGPLDEAIVERLGARRAPGALGAATL